MERDLERLLDRAGGEARRCVKLQKAIPGRFVSLAELPALKHIANTEDILLSTCGGWQDAERVQYCYHPRDEEPCFTACWLGISWADKFVTLSHRDLLGSLMALGMDRSYFGDLLMQDGQGFLYCLSEMAMRLPQEWQEAGHARLHVQVLDQVPDLRPPEGVPMRITVASVRLDTVLSDALRMSRAKGAEVIRQGHVSVNHLEETRVDRVLKPGDLLSVRGFGRVRVSEIQDMNRKGRIPVTLSLFSSK